MPAQALDHAVVVCPDLDAVADRWHTLGFTLTPRGFHTLGSQNHCIMLQRDYLELLHVTQPATARQYYWDAQLHGGGCVAMSCRSDDAFADAASLRAQGWHMSDPVEFSRRVALDGTQRDATFRVTALDEAPGARYFLCEHRTPELLWRDDWTAHVNGASGIETMFLVVAPSLVDAAARAYADLTGGLMMQEDVDCCSVSLDGAQMVITTPKRLGQAAGTDAVARDVPGYAAIRLRTASLETAREVWRANAVAAIDLGPDESLIPAGAAGGVGLLFRQER